VERVDAYFERTGKRPDGGARIVVKSAIVLAWLVASYVGLVFWASTWWQALPMTLALALAVAAVGFNVQHDGGHDAYAKSRRGNHLAAYALDLVGGSSYVWRFKHAFLHHHYTNLDGVDDDVDAAPFLRLAPTQRRRWYHRFQHWYAWILFGFLPPKWVFYDDFSVTIRGRIGSQPIPRPKPTDVVLMVAGKVVYLGLAFVVPVLAGHGIWAVVGCYGLFALFAGITLSITFQLAHCVEEADFPRVHRGGGRVDRPWMEHQLATTVDFAPRNRVLTWFMGGLNFQVEHHLFPRISHVHYPEISPIVRQTCAEFGVRHLSHDSFFPALRSHVRHMRRLGQSG
jgi:linoleoyl-CoA desaturase